MRHASVGCTACLQGFDNPRQHRRHNKGRGDIVLLCQFDPTLSAEIRQLNNMPSGVDRAHDRGDASDMIRRHADQGRICFRRTGKFHRRQNVAHQVFVPENRRLGLAGCAAGKQQHGHLIWVHTPFVLDGCLVLLCIEESIGGNRVHIVQRAEGRDAITGCNQIGWRHALQQRCNFFVG